jgi:hypothetical protein
VSDAELERLRALERIAKSRYVRLSMLFRDEATLTAAHDLWWDADQKVKAFESQRRGRDSKAPDV